MADNIRPLYRIQANGSDITDNLNDRLISLSYTDAAGLESDMLEITLADNDLSKPILIPPSGAELELFMGYDSSVTRMGLFVFDEMELSGWPGEMVIRAKAAQYDDSKGGKTFLQTQKVRSWKAGTKLGDMVSKIAKEHGMTAAVSPSLASIALPHIVQPDESDLNLLIRIGKKYDAVVKPAGGKLVLAKRGEAKTMSGADLPSVSISTWECTRWRMVQSKRETAGKVVAYWHVVKQAKRHEVSVGSGEPVRRLKQYFPTEDMALAAARAELAKRERGSITLYVEMPGRTDLAAESKLILKNWRVGVPAEWIITHVEHRLDDGGYSCRIEAEQPNSDDTEEVTSTASG